MTVMMLVSGIQLEILSGRSVGWIWCHIVIGVIYLILVLWHLQLHFQWRNWLRLLWKNRSRDMKWLTVTGILTAVTGILTAVTGIIATAGWIASPSHSMIGAVHGKLGFLFILLAVWHGRSRAKIIRKKHSR